MKKLLSFLLLTTFSLYTVPRLQLEAGTVNFTGNGETHMLNAIALNGNTKIAYFAPEKLVAVFRDGMNSSQCLTVNEFHRMMAFWQSNLLSFLEIAEREPVKETLRQFLLKIKPTLGTVTQDKKNTLLIHTFLAATFHQDITDANTFNDLWQSLNSLPAATIMQPLELKAYVNNY